MNKRLLLPLLALLLTALACSFRNPLTNPINFDFTITESQLNTGNINIDLNVPGEDDLVKSVDNIDLQPGKMVFTGTFITPDGGEVDGTLEVGFTAEDGVPVVTILSIDAGSLDLSDPRLVSAQKAITTGISEGFTDQDVVRVESIEVTDTEIKFKLSGSIDQNR